MGRRWTWRGRGCALVAGCLTVLAVPAVASAATVSVWHMDETSGSTMVDSVGSNDGTLNAVTLGVPGFAATGYRFNGSSSVVTAPSAASLNPGSSPFWLSVHVNFTSTPSVAIGGDFDLIRKGLSGTTGGFYKLELFPSGQAHCSMEGSSNSKSLTAGPDLRDGRWHTVQCVKDSLSLSVVVDGHRSSTPTQLGSFGNNDRLAIGAKAEGGDWYDGAMDEVSFGTGELAAPSNTAAPTIGGTPATGSPLTASAGTWAGTQPIAYAYQWQRCNAASGGCAAIAGATTSTYTPVVTDQGKMLRVVVTATSPAGTGNATSAAITVAAALPALGPPDGTGAAADPQPASSPPAPVDLVAVSPSETSSCTVLLPGSAVRRARLQGGGGVTLRFDARARTTSLAARPGVVRSVTYTIDGKRLRRARGGSSHASIPEASLRRGAHVLGAIVHPRHGRARTLVVRLSVSAC